MRRRGGIRKQRAAWPLLLLALLPLAGLLAACGNASAGPQTTVRFFLAGWGARDWSSMRHVVLDPPAAFATINAAALSDLEVSRASYVAGSPIVSRTTARVPVTEDLTIPGFGVWTVRTTLHLAEHSGRWLVQWSPETIDPSFRPGSHFAVTTTWPPRAPILGTGGVALTTEEETAIVGVEGNYVKDPSSLSAALVAAGATDAEVSTALAAAKTNPTYFEPVFTVPWARYLQLKPILYPLPGTVFQTAEVREAITPGLEADLVGRVGPITAEELHALGTPYDATSIVGQTGLEQIDQAQLTGTPETTISVVSDHGSSLATLATNKPVAGTPVRTSIDPVIQRAAEAALAHEQKPAALVAVDTRTGQVLASVSDPSNDAFDQALDGTFPPGSTFKTITSTALIERGLSPSSPASCPATITVGGELFHNAEGDAPVQNMAQAFTESCNTAFIGLATKGLEPASLPTAAAEYDIGKSPDMGIPVFGGSVPTPTSAAELAATAIGQGRVLVSPLDMAMVAAAIDSGVVREPRLVLGSPDDRSPTRRLPTNVVEDLHEMMADVVAGGTAANQGLPPGTYAKTGTAEYGTGNPLPTDAWLIGFRGNVAFAVLVVDGGYGGPTDGPIAASFLDAVGAPS